MRLIGLNDRVLYLNKISLCKYIIIYFKLLNII